MADDDPTPDPIDDSIDSLKARLEEERQARLAAEGRASNAERQATRQASEAQRSGNEVQRTQLQVLDSSLDQIKTQRDILRARLRSASAEGDHDMVADISVEMSDIGARLLYLENGRDQLKQQIENPPTPPSQGDQRPFNSLSSAEKVDRIAQGLSAQSAAWVRAHPEWAQSDSKVNALVGAHNAALARGRIADTPEYFSDVERILGVEAPGVSNGTDRNEPVRTRAEVPPPAAPARSGGGGRSRTLSATEREFARIGGQTDEEYAAAQDALAREGRLTRH